MTINNRFPGPGSDPENFFLQDLTTLKDQMDNFNNRKVFDRIKSRFFRIHVLQIKEILTQIQNMDNLIHDKFRIDKNFKLKRYFEEKQLTNRLAWSTSDLYLPRPISETSPKIAFLGFSSKEEKDSLFWRQDMKAAETMHCVRKTLDFVAWCNVNFVNLENYLNLIQSNNTAWIRKMEILYSIYNLPKEHLDTVRFGLAEVWPGLQQGTSTLNSFSNHVLKIQTEVDGVEQFTSRKDYRESLDKLFPVNPWVVFEIQGTANSLAQLGKTRKFPYEFLFNLRDIEDKLDFVKKSLSPISADMDSARRYYFDA